MLFVCYPKCTTCQKAQRFLDAHGARYTLRDIRADRPTRDELTAWHAQSGLPLRRFFNTSGLQYRALGLKDRLPAMTEADMLDLLATDGMLVKRPLLIAGERVLVGFREKEWAELLETLE
ncbi:MAG: arsenate reductase family protein [Candidatus Ventricola sp.]